MRLLTFPHHAELHWQLLGESEARQQRFDAKGRDPVGVEFAFRKELGDFVRWVEEGTEPCLTWREGLRCVEVIEAARRSAKQKGSWIQLPLYPELE
jgi:predicted dehydrogenase